MSATVLSLIPLDPRHVPPAETHEPALDLLVELVQGWEPEVIVSEHLRFIGSGGNYSSDVISCPRCNTRLRLEERAAADWFSAQADAALEAAAELEWNAEGITVSMLCCGAELPFIALQFEEQGFARFELQVYDPDERELSQSDQARVEAIVGCSMKQVWARV